MGSKRLIICDPEEGHALALAAYIAKRKELALQVQVCSSPEQVKEVGEEAEYLFISAVYGPEERESIRAHKKFVLMITGRETLEAEEVPVFKYQSGENILAELIQCCQESTSVEGIFHQNIRKEAGKLIGVFSPVHRTGKTGYALKLGRQLYTKSETLYVNMEIYGGLGGYFPENFKYTLGDVLYYYRQESDSLYSLLPAMAYQDRGLDCILPVPVSEDIKTVAPKEWTGLLKGMLEKSIYETIVIDLDEGIQGVYDILRMCAQVYVPVTEGTAENPKMRQFEQELHLMGYAEIVPRLMKEEVRL